MYNNNLPNYENYEKENKVVLGKRQRTVVNEQPLGQPAFKKRKVQAPLNRKLTHPNFDVPKIGELTKSIHDNFRGFGIPQVKTNRLFYNGNKVAHRNGRPVRDVRHITQVFPVSIRSPGKTTGHAVGVVKVPAPWGTTGPSTLYVFDPHGKNRRLSTDAMAVKLAKQLRARVIKYNRNVPQEHNTKGVCFGLVSLFLRRVSRKLSLRPNKTTFENIVHKELGKFNSSRCNRLNTWLRRPMTYPVSMK